MPYRYTEERRRAREDAEIEAVGSVVDGLALVMPYRRLIQEVRDPPADIVAEYRAGMLAIHASLEFIARVAFTEDQTTAGGGF